MTEEQHREKWLVRVKKKMYQVARNATYFCVGDPTALAEVTMNELDEEIGQGGACFLHADSGDDCDDNYVIPQYVFDEAINVYEEVVGDLP